jgi:hypothetical protein
MFLSESYIKQPLASDLYEVFQRLKYMSIKQQKTQADATPCAIVDKCWLVKHTMKNCRNWCSRFICCFLYNCNYLDNNAVGVAAAAFSIFKLEIYMNISSHIYLYSEYLTNSLLNCKVTAYTVDKLKEIVNLKGRRIEEIKQH